MQRMIRLIGIVLILALSAPTASAQQPARSYLLLGKHDKLPANLQQSVAQKGGTIAYTVPEIGLAVLTSSNPNFQAQIAGMAEVESVAPDIQVNFYLPGFQPSAPPTVSPPMPDDDMFYMFQWNLDAIDAPQAWAQGALGAGVRIAILDDGILADHPDLAPNLNVSLSKSFVPGDPAPFTPMGFPSHASHVAGVAAAADNGIGIIGVAPQAEIVGIRVLTWELTPNGYVPEGKFAWLAAGIVYAANIGSDIINISLGGWVDKNGYCDDDGVCVSKKEAKELVKLLDRATRYAHRKGAVVIAAAGNDGTDTDTNGKNYFLPAESDKVIAVSATGPSGWILNPTTDLDIFAPYSNYGKKMVDLAAPGGNPTFLNQNPSCIIPFSGFPIPCGFFDLIIAPTATPFLWTWASGTSSAVPHVSGVAALVIGKNGGKMDPNKVEEALFRGADDLGKKGKDPFFGNGRVNALGALNARMGKDKKANDEGVDEDVVLAALPYTDEASVSETAQAELSMCVDAAWVCIDTNKNLQFLAQISNR